MPLPLNIFLNTRYYLHFVPHEQKLLGRPRLFLSMAIPHSGQNRFAQAAVNSDISINPPVREIPYPCSGFREVSMKKAALDFYSITAYVIPYVAGPCSRFALFYAAFWHRLIHFADSISRTCPQAGTPYATSRIFTREGRRSMETSL